jgi:hypothetical protein
MKTIVKFLPAIALLAGLSTARADGDPAHG